MFDSKIIHLKDELKISSGKFVNLQACVSDTATDKPILLVFHGLSSDSQLLNWWNKFNWAKVNEKYRIICINTIGSAFGSTGPGNYSFYNNENKLVNEFPLLTIRDSIEFTLLVLKEMNIESVDTVLGCSLGGMQTLELYSMHPKFAKKFISTCACELPLNIKLYNYTQISLLEEAMRSQLIDTLKLAYKYSRFFFRISCTTNNGLEYFENKLAGDDTPTNANSINHCLKYYLEDGEKYYDYFPYASYIAIMKMISDFKYKSTQFSNVSTNLFMIGIKNDQFTPPEMIRKLSDQLVKNNNNVLYYEFDTIFGHEAWILDGERFYEYISQFIF